MEQEETTAFGVNDAKINNIHGLNVRKGRVTDIKATQIRHDRFGAASLMVPSLLYKSQVASFCGVRGIKQTGTCC